MQRITKKQIQEYISEVGDFEKEHRKGYTFYCTATHTFKQEDIDTLAEENSDASELLGITVLISGIYDDWNGRDWYDMLFNKYEEYQELVPEVVIPAHYETKYREVPFTIEFE